MLVLFLLAETSAVAQSYGDRVVIDLTVSEPCAADEVQRLQSEIVVCARRDGDGRDRLTNVKTANTGILPRAELHLSDGTVLSAETESADLGMARSQRLMVRVKFKF